MKLLQINVVCGVKSTGRIVAEIATFAEEKGYECKIGYGREEVPAPFCPYAVKIGSSFSTLSHALCARVYDGAGLGSKRATKKFIAWVKEYDPDVIHLHNLHGYYLHLPTLFDYLKEADKKVVWTLHDCWAFTGHCAHFELRGCEKWKTGCHDCSQKKEYPTTRIDKSKRNYAWKKQTFTGVKDMTIVTPSKWLAGLVKQSFLKEYPVEVVYNGIDMDKFLPTPSHLKEDYDLQDKKIVLGVATAWGEKKGLQDFYTLSKLLGEDYQVVLIGLTDAQIKKAPKEVLALPKTDSVATLAKWYTAADVFVNCTYEETMSLVNVEAQACGTPVLTYGAGGTVETVPAENVVEKGNVTALAEKIPQTILKKNLADLSNFFKDEAIKKYLDLYKTGR